MPSLQKIDCSRFDELYPLLELFDSPLSKDLWKSLFDYQWARSEDYCGYGLFDDGVPVGYLGMLFSQRTIEQQTHHFCNLTSWIVRPDYRSHSLSMMMPIMRLKNHTVTDLSASETVIKLSERLGFKYLDKTVQVLLPLPLGLGQSKAQTLRFYQDDEISELSLTDSEQRIFEDHRRYSDCHQLVIQVTPDEYCHVLYTVHPDSKLSYCHIQSISNIEVFERYQADIRKCIGRAAGISLIVVDSRFVASLKLPLSVEIPVGSPRIYRSNTLQAAQVDNLYSEYILLGLRSLGIREVLLDTFPAIRQLKHLRPQKSPEPMLKSG